MGHNPVHAHMTMRDVVIVLAMYAVAAAFYGVVKLVRRVRLRVLARNAVRLPAVGVRPGRTQLRDR